MYFLKNTFGHVEIQQIIWNLNQNNTGADDIFYIIATKYLSISVVAIVALYLITYKHEKLFVLTFGQSRGLKLSKYFLCLLLVTSVCYVIGGINRFSYKTNLYSYFMDNYFPKEFIYDFIKENYYVPTSDEVTFNNKKIL